MNLKTAMRIGATDRQLASLPFGAATACRRIFRQAAQSRSIRYCYRECKYVWKCASEKAWWEHIEYEQPLTREAFEQAFAILLAGRQQEAWKGQR